MTERNGRKCHKGEALAATKTLNPTKVNRRVLLAGKVIDVGDAEGLDWDGTNAQQQLAQKQHRVHH